MLEKNKIYCMDCIEGMKQLDDNSVDTIITDPPYFLNFMGKKWDNAELPIPPDFGYWFSGLVDGEGCFRIHKNNNGNRYSCEFSIKMRADERPILEKIKNTLKIGRLSEEKRGYDNSKPCVKFLVENQEECFKLAKIFFYYPLRAKKGNDFKVWYKALVEWCGLPRGNRWHGKGNRGRMPEYYEEIKEKREYTESPRPFKPEQLAHYMWATEALRVIKPGGTTLVFSGSRTHHHLACALEDAGFILKDCIMWLYGSGFPKATDISKQLDKKAGKEREVVGKVNYTMPKADNSIQANSYGISGGSLKDGNKADRVTADITQPSSSEAQLWNGWKSHGLKPAYEPILVCMKPNEGSYAENALKHGVSGLNIDGGRIEHNEPLKETNRQKDMGNSWDSSNCGLRANPNNMASASPQGRFPANIILDEESAKLLDEQSGISKSNGGSGQASMKTAPNDIYGKYKKGYKSDNLGGLGDKGGASRFFYTAKASKSERNFGCEKLEPKKVQIQQPHNSKTLEERYNLSFKNHHPTVKPIKLMEYLCKLTKTPTGGIVLDPFAGSGTTGIACKKTGRDFILIEKEPEYVEIAKARLNAIQGKQVDLNHYEGD